MPIASPMPPFPSLSKTSLGAFRDCERRWALQYQKHKLPDELKVDIALEAKLMPHNAFVGQVVDDTITGALRTYQEKGYWPRKKSLEEYARELFGQYLSATERWIYLRKTRSKPEDLKRQPIDRVYYGLPYKETEKQELFARIDACLKCFQESEIPEWVTSFDPGYWRVAEKGTAPWFDWDRIAVYAKYDFAIVTHDHTYIVDWKTGEAKKESEASATDQLHIYAKYAMSVWGSRREDMTLRSVWLSSRPEKCIHDQSVDVDVLARLFRDFKKTHEDLKQRLKRAEFGLEALFEQFPKTGFPRRCKQCAFHSCEGWIDSQGYKKDE